MRVTNTNIIRFAAGRQHKRDIDILYTYDNNNIRIKYRKSMCFLFFFMLIIVNRTRYNKNEILCL